MWCDEKIFTSPTPPVSFNFLINTHNTHTSQVGTTTIPTTTTLLHILLRTHCKNLHTHYTHCKNLHTHYYRNPVSFNFLTNTPNHKSKLARFLQLSQNSVSFNFSPLTQPKTQVPKIPFPSTFAPNGEMFKEQIERTRA